MILLEHSVATDGHVASFTGRNERKTRETELQAGQRVSSSEQTSNSSAHLLDVPSFGKTVASWQRVAK